MYEGVLNIFRYVFEIEKKLIFIRMEDTSQIPENLIIRDDHSKKKIF